MIPIRVLQIVLIMVNNEDVLRVPMSTKILNFCLKAFNDNSQIIKGNVFIVLKQMYTLLFKEYKNECQKSYLLDNKDIYKICLEHLDRLILITKDKKSPMSLKCMCMDTLSSIFIEGHTALAITPEMNNLLCQSYADQLNKFITNTSAPYMILKSAADSMARLIVITNEYEHIQSFEQLANSEASWQRHLALNAFTILLGTYKQLQVMYTMVNKNNKMKVLIMLMDRYWVS